MNRWVNVRSRLRRRVAVVGAVLSLGTVLVAADVASAAAGDLDLGFGGAGHGRVEFDLGGSGSVKLAGMAVQPDGGLVSVGTDLVPGGFDEAMAYRLHPDGTPDTRFGKVRLPHPSGTSALAEAAVAQPDGKIVVAGSIYTPGVTSDMAVWRLTRTGKLDTSFDGDGLVTVSVVAGSSEFASDVALDPQGRIVVAGATSLAGGDDDFALARLTATGAPDGTFNGGAAFFVHTHPGFDGAQSVAVQSDGEILLAGTYGIENAVLRITPGTASTAALLDGTFGGGTFPAGSGIADVPGTASILHTDVAVTAHGAIYVFDQVFHGGHVVGTVVRLLRDGSVDDGFGAADGTGAHLVPADGVDFFVDKLAVLPGGGVVAVEDDGGRFFIAKLRANGNPDTGMGRRGIKKLGDLDALGGGIAVAALPDGRIVAAGELATAADTGLAYRLLGDFKAPSCGGKKATITGTTAPDRLVGTRRVDVIAGLGGGDRITGTGKGDIVCGSRGRDHLAGGAGADYLLGQSGHDTLLGGTGDDRLIGGPDHDRLNGGPGRDTLRQ